jgi:hypothetical protein
MTWKTQLIMYFGTNGDTTISDIVSKVEKVGFKSALGPVDFEYVWEKEPSKKEIFELGDKVKEALKDTGAIFNLDTHD